MTWFERTRAAPAQGREEVVVRAVRPVPWGGAVFCASAPRTSAISTGQATARTATQQRLVTILSDHVETSQNSSGKRSPSNGSTLEIQLAHDALGRPYLRSGGCRGSSVSFSEGGGKLWAALCGKEAEIGIDVAGSDEFPEAYPFRRVFHGDELHHALRSAGGDLGKAAALLWSIKEAVVKAFGCAFHGVDPLHITIHPRVRDDDGQAFHVGLSQKALRRLPQAATRPLWVRAFPQEKLWLSIALLIRQA